MDAGSRNNAGGRSGAYIRYVGIDRVIAEHPAYLEAPLIEKQLYFDLRRQCNGRNNGNITAALSVMARYGWSRRSLFKALKGLRRRGLIKVTREGGIASMSKVTQLYAFTHESVVQDNARGVKGSPPTGEYMLYQSTPKVRHTRAPPKKKGERSRGDLIGSSGDLSKGHAVPMTAVEGSSGDLRAFPQKSTEVIDARVN